MSKTIRPLAAFKKAYPELYNIVYLPFMESQSKKGQENEFYLTYAILELKTKLEQLQDTFFFTPNGAFTNKGTVSEIGRLLLYGWYYDIEDWAQEVALYIYKANKKIESAGEAFNDLEFKEAVKHIRDNIGYYYHNEPELKLYILETFFNEKLQALLPEKPKELKSYDNTVEFISQIRKNQKKKGIDYWINKKEDYEGYSFYLAEILEDYNLEFLTFEDYNTKEEEEAKDKYKNIEKLREDYKAQYIEKVKKIDLT